MKETLRFTVDASGERLDLFLSQQCPSISRSQLQRLIQEGHVAVEGRPARPSLRLRPGQLVVLTMPEPSPTHLVPQSIPLTVVYEDSDLLVVDKPPGLPVHPSPGHPDLTLANAVLALYPDLPGVGGTLRPGIVHRLDKDTSGLMVVAKSQAAYTSLSRQIKGHTITKGYLALAHGYVKPSEGVIEAPIGRHPRNRKKMAVVADGREARTRYKVIAQVTGFSLLEAWPETGRTHQIRVHLASISHPLAGDVTYGGRTPGLDRQFLHARVLGFTHPTTGDYVEFDSGPPSDLTAFLDTLKPGPEVVRYLTSWATRPGRSSHGAFGGPVDGGPCCHMFQAVLK